MSLSFSGVIEGAFSGFNAVVEMKDPASVVG
jgi:hypothetical protein